MSENTSIEWADHSFNPWEGCQKVSPGCDHCYAETRNARFAGGTAINWGSGAPRRRTSAANWRKPLAWNAAHAEFYVAHGHRQRVFCANNSSSLSKEPVQPMVIPVRSPTNAAISSGVAGPCGSQLTVTRV